MERTLKTLLLWFLMALVPLQAGAAAMGMSCGPAHQQTMAAAMAAAADHHEHDSIVGHQHDGAGTTAAEADPVPSADASDASAGPGHSTCSACSDFCIGAVAPPSSFNSPLAFNGAESVVIALSPSVAGFVPDGLKRPPRNISA